MPTIKRQVQEDGSIKFLGATFLPAEKRFLTIAKQHAGEYLRIKHSDVVPTRIQVHEDARDGAMLWSAYSQVTEHEAEHDQQHPDDDMPARDVTTVDADAQYDVQKSDRPSVTIPGPYDPTFEADDAAPIVSPSNAELLASLGYLEAATTGEPQTGESDLISGDMTAQELAQHGYADEAAHYNAEQPLITHHNDMLVDSGTGEVLGFTDATITPGKAENTRIEIKLIRTNGGTQPRALINADRVYEYAERMSEGDKFPSVVVFFDGTEYWLADGFHRLAAARQLNKEYINADVRAGQLRDAILYAASANATHGLQRTHDDKRRQVIMLLKDDQWRGWADREIARRVRVSQPFVSSLRRTLESNGEISAIDERTYHDRHGNVNTMRTKGINERSDEQGTDFPDEMYQGNTPIQAPVTTQLDPQSILEYVENHPEITDALRAKLNGQRAAKQQQNKQQRIAAAQDLPDDIFNVILLDDPWQFNNVGVNGAAENHYPTMTTAQLKTLFDDIGLNIAQDAIMFMWVPASMSEVAHEVARARGFEYKTQWVWPKDEVLGQPGTGWYGASEHELVFICTRGNMTPFEPKIVQSISSVIRGDVREHSRKPEIRDRIERLYPGCKYIEFFARERREGWTQWGNEVGKFDEQQSLPMSDDDASNDQEQDELAAFE